MDWTEPLERPMTAVADAVARPRIAAHNSRETRLGQPMPLQYVFAQRNLRRPTGDTPGRTTAAHRVEVRRPGIVVINARSTAFTDSGRLKTRATSGSNRMATDPFGIRPANRF